MDRAQIPKEEQETSIVIDPLAKTATVYSCVPATIRRIESFRNEPDVEIISDDKYGITAKMPAKWIKIVKPQKREYTDEQRDALRERLEKARAVAQENKKQEGK